jgi:tetratricopeptide (TPR) repeat protein
MQNHYFGKSYKKEDYMYPSSLNHSEVDYTVYTDNSGLSSSFELEAKAQTLLDYNAALIKAISAFVQKDIPEVIRTYREALDLLESEANPKISSVISTKCNLGVAHYYNSESDKAVFYIQEAMDHFKGFRESPQNYDYEKQSLLLKCWCNMMIVKLTSGDDRGYKEVLFDLHKYLESL